MPTQILRQKSVRYEGKAQLLTELLIRGSPLCEMILQIRNTGITEYLPTSRATQASWYRVAIGGKLKLVTSPITSPPPMRSETGSSCDSKAPSCVLNRRVGRNPSILETEDAAVVRVSHSTGAASKEASKQGHCLRGAILHVLLFIFRRKAEWSSTRATLKAKNGFLVNARS